MHLDELYELFKIVLGVLYKRWITVLLKPLPFARLLFKGILGWSSFQYFENAQILMCLILKYIYIESIGSSF